MRRVGKLIASTLLIPVCIIVAGCNSASVRDDPSDNGIVPDASALHRDFLLEPGPPPADLATPSDVAVLERIRQRAQAMQRSNGLQLDSGRVRYADLWERLRASMVLNGIDHPRIRKEIAWYARRPDYIRRVTDRARLYLAYIVLQVEERGLPGELALLPVVESAFQPYARSPAGASGIWQFMGPTGRRFGLRRSVWYDARRDIVESTRAALDYLSFLHGDLGEDWPRAIAAYNAGEGNVLRAMKRNRASSAPIDFFSLDLPAETEAYVPRLLAVAAIIADPQRHGIVLDPIDERPYFQVVDTPGQVDLAKAADMAGISLNELMLLNPGFMRHASDPAGPHRLLLPVDAVSSFTTALDESPARMALSHRVHEVAAGETLAAIARRYGTTAGAIRASNNLPASTLKVGQQLQVPDGFDAQRLAGLSREVREGMKRARGDERRTVYRVRSGDNLWLIARRHETTVARLKSWNRIGRRNMLKPGQKLVIWSASRSSPGTMPVKFPSGVPVHVVQRGDSLWSIGRRYGVSTKQLRSWNRLSRNALLKPGQTLQVALPASASGGGVASS